MQGNHVICYESTKMKDHEKKYSTHDLELAAIVHALKMWRHYFMGRISELRTDHCGLKCLFDQPTLNARQARWLEFICKFDFEINHIKGKENKVVLAASNNPFIFHYDEGRSALFYILLKIIIECLQNI